MFVIKKTKLEFVRELETFVRRNVQVYGVLNWRVLRRRRTEEERQGLHCDAHYQEWVYITNIAEADAIKLTAPPFRGLVLEIEEWPKLAINAEGEQESVTVAEDGVCRHKGYRHKAVNTEAHAALSAWLHSLETPETTPAEECASKIGRPPLTTDEWKERFETVERVLEKKRKLGGITEEQACAREAVPYSTFKGWKRAWRKRQAMDD